MKMRRSRVAAASTAALTAVLLAPQAVSAVGVVGIDFGTAWIKASLMKPGLPFDVVLGKDSKRKIQAAVAWKGEDDRLFGTDAANLASRYPADSFQATKLLLGIPCGSDKASAEARPFVDRVAGLHGNVIVPASEDRAACSYQRANANSTLYSVEELVGMQLANIKGLAEATAGERISAFSSMTSSGAFGLYGGLDAAITIPAFYTAAERQAIYDAAGLVGMRPRLVSDGAAVAVNYALTRTFPQPELHVFYDSGAGSTRATLVEFSTQKVTPDSILTAASTPKEVTNIDVLAVGWDRTAGGLALDLIVRDILIKKFEASPAATKLQTPLRQNQRAMAKLLREANRVKHILSANAFASSSIEGLAEDIDFRTRVEREDFEASVRAAKLDDGFVAPLAQLLKSASTKVSSYADINSVVLVGGNSRVPLVQQAITTAGGVPESKLAQNVNADEAAVMGAAFYGASFNPQLKMKAIRARDYNPYPIVLKEPNSKPQVVFPTGPFETDAILRQYDNVVEDFELELGYEHAIPIFGTQSTRFNVSGISSALNAIKTAGEIKSVETQANISVVGRPLGTLGFDDAEILVKRKPGTIVDSVRSFFGGSIIPSFAKDLNDTDADAANDTETQAERDANLKADRSLLLSVVRLPPSSGARDGKMASDEYRASKDRLYSLDRAAERRSEREEARNQLESYLYRVRDLLDDDKSFEAASKPAERETISAKLSELQSWVSGDGDGADTALLRLKRASLETLVKPVEKRLTQASARTTAFSKFEKVQVEADAFLLEARANLTSALAKGEGSKYSAAELDSLDRTLTKDGKWFKEGVEAQKKRGPNEDAAINVEEVEKRAKKISDTIAKLKRRKIPKTRPKSASSKTTSSSSSSKASSGAKSESTADSSKSDSEPKVVHDEL
ncbi:lumenal Hsp70 protein [Tilletia horrida]|uniref:Lumenal Hsp70 protein n=1 Tax=Tilletia horrida TaxID=155126 RepID=A0AAN6JRB2_9BASI|nr:lumenal Hsp70 protein [Tilletia horrida]